MVDKIIKNYCPKLSSFTSKLISSNSTLSKISEYKQAIKTYLDIVDSRQAISDAFISAFSANPEVFAAEQAGYDVYNTAKNYSYKISTEASEILLNMFDSQSSDILTFTDSGSYPYSVIRSRTSEYLLDHVRPLITTQQHPQTRRDCLLYADEQGDIYFNPVIRITDFVDGSEIANLVPSSINEAVSMLCVIGDVIDTGSIKDDFNSLNDEYGFSQSTTILGMLSDLATFLSLEQPSTINDVVEHFTSYAWALFTYAEKPRIHSTTIYGLINNLVVNNELIDTIRTVYDNVTNGDVNQLVTCIRSTIDGKSSTVRQFGNKILSGFSRSGVLGALGVIIDLLRDVFTSEPTGYKVFNTADSIPQAFSAGFVAIITGIGQTLFQILSNVMNPVISIIGAIGYTIFDVISNIINVNVSQEYASINDLDKCEIISPYALFGAQVPVSSARLSSTFIPNDEGKMVSIKSMLDWATLNGSPVLTIEWVSCVMKIAYVEPEINYEQNSVYADNVVINVFPTVQDTTAYFPNDAISNIWKTYTSINIPAVGDGYIQYNDWRTKYQNTITIVNTQLNSLLRSNSSFKCHFNNDKDGQYAGYAYSNDLSLRRIVYINSLFTLALIYRYTGFLVTLGTGVITVPLKLSPVWTVRLDGSAFPYIELCIGAITDQSKSFIDYQGTTIFLKPETSSYESLAKAIANIQDNSPAYFAGSYYLKALVASRTDRVISNDIPVSYLTTNGALISYHNSYVDIPYFTPPKYIRGTVISTIVIGAIITVATAVAVVGLTIATKRLLNRQRAVREARVDAAWSELTKHPDAEHYDAYRRAVKSNNRFTRIFGGTKYDYVNYWHGDASSNDESAPSPFEEILSGSTGNETTLDTKPIDSVAPIIKLITGRDLDS